MKKELKNESLEKVTGGRKDNRETKHCPECGWKFTVLRGTKGEVSCLACKTKIKY